MTTRLWKGSTLIGMANAGKMVTKKISAQQAVNSITNKFGGIDRESSYYHRAKNVWSIHDPALDGTRKSEAIGKQYGGSRSHLGDRSRKKQKGRGYV